MTNPLNGRVITDFENYDQSFSIIIQPDGKFLVAGCSGFRQHYKPTLARYDITGKLDKNFAANGVTIDTKETYWGYNADVAIQNDGKIIVSGEIDGNFHLPRYNSNGILDASFNKTGEIIDNFGGLDFPAELAIQPDQKILVVGVGGSSNLTIARYTSDGLRDISFVNNGLISTDFGAPYDYGTSLGMICKTPAVTVRCETVSA